MPATLAKEGVFAGSPGRDRLQRRRGRHAAAIGEVVAAGHQGAAPVHAQRQPVERLQRHQRATLPARADAARIARRAGHHLPGRLVERQRGHRVARTNRRLTLLLGATSTERRPFSKMSPPLLEAIRWARGHGALELDLGGVPREGDTDAKRAAIAAFKHGFTKDTIDLVREHVRWG